MMPMRPFRFLLVFFCGLFFLLPSAAPGAVRPVGEAIREAIRQRLEAPGLPEALTICNVCLRSTPLLSEYYQQGLYEAAWIEEEGRPRAAARELMAAIRSAAEEGLVPAHYHLAALQDLLRRAVVGKPSAVLAADLDILLTDAFLLLGSHLLDGRVDPVTIDRQWRVVRREGDLLRTLREALAGQGVAAALQGLLPHQEGYRSLRTALARYRDLAHRGGWPGVPAGPSLRAGDEGGRVAALRRRLAADGDPARAAAQGDAFDGTLLEAVLEFQGRHGLEADGVVGAKTLAALNVPVSARVRQIELNMERWRWMPQNLGRRHVLVNTAAFHLDMVADDESVLSMRVVVGRPYRSTPDFSGSITYLVLNPYWEIPPSIAVKDILPQIRKDSGYLQRMGIRVFRGWGAEARAVDPATIDWGRLGPRSFPYRLRQDPGPVNALGRIKFMFPNAHNVYLHDTPSRELFLRETRSFSSGCIRLEKPMELAALLLTDTPLDTVEALEEARQGQISKTVRLPAPVPVHLVYWTAWAERDGTVRFRNDIYGRDSLLDLALSMPPPATF
jgi:murein L,D-transpeptidase YcbB/YkuD